MNKLVPALNRSHGPFHNYEILCLDKLVQVVPQIFSINFYAQKYAYYSCIMLNVCKALLCSKLYGMICPSLADAYMATVYLIYKTTPNYM